MERQLIGKCLEIRQLRIDLPEIAASNRRVLVSGATGTGKTLVAGIIHQINGRKRYVQWTPAQPPINQDRWHDSVVCIEDVDKLSRKKQQKLLAALDRQPGLPLLCTSRKSLPSLCDKGRFDLGLYHRIAELPLFLPALHERGRPDILGLAKHVLDMQGGALRFSRSALDAMARHDWPGNVRELVNRVARAALLRKERTVINAQLLGLRPNIDSLEQTAERASSAGAPTASSQSKKEKETAFASVEGESLKEYFQRFVLKHESNMSETALARKLGISRKCLWERRQRLGIPRKNIAKRS